MIGTGHRDKRGVDPMPDALILEFAGLTDADYAAVNENLGIDADTGKGAWPAGMPSHAAGPDPPKPSGQGGRAAFGHLRGDDRPLDFAGAFPDALDPQFPEEALGHVLAHVAAAAQAPHD